MFFQALYLKLTFGVNADVVRTLESLLSNLSDATIVEDIEWLVDLWYGIRGAVTRFAEWVKGRMDVLKAYMSDPQFSRTSAALQLPQDGKVSRHKED